mgnify:FL=1|jgi:hypothetical protein|tara:strand:- start:75 stop:365 length:291 start_codon:yes stop_codon:yes gene_type:complete
MTFYYETNSWTSQPQPNHNQVKLWNHICNKANWRIVQLPNGYYQTEYQDLQDEEKWIDVTRRETMQAAETAIDKTVEHYQKKVEFLNGPKVVKTFK